ncbi:hypothetical protein ABZ341_18350 [Streptomyces sp. NPDC006173]|uniref:hypothetical protein n=1 Tax=Streptomyces sp. NPDC006173 TaxID=3155349 RepID=UPI0033CE751A
MIAFPRATVPVPDAVANLVGRQLPEPIRQARRESWEACVNLTYCRHPRYEEGRQLALAGIAAATKTLAAHNPGLVHSWADLPGLTR